MKGPLKATKCHSAKAFPLWPKPKKDKNMKRKT